MKKLPLIACCEPIARPTLSDSEAGDLERVFKALADRHRIKILNMLSAAGGAVCVCDFVPALGLKQPTVSYHLKVLMDAGLLERERRGTYAHFRLAPGALGRVSALLGEPAELAAAV